MSILSNLLLYLVGMWLQKLILISVCKDSARRAQCKMKVKKLSFSLPSRSLSYLKIVQGERNAK